MAALVGLIMITFCLVVLPTRVWAAQEEGNPAITIEAYSLLANWTKPGSWLSLAVEVTNRGPDFNGQIRIPYGQNRPDLTTDYVQSAVVPQGATKLFTFNIPVFDSLSTLDIELVNSQGVVAKGQASFTPIGTGQFLVGLLDRTEDGFSSLGGLKAASGLSPLVFGVKSASLPEQADLLNLLDVLVVDDVNLKLTGKQSAALTHWVAQGGTLIAGGGPGWQKVFPNLPPALRVVNVTGVENQTLSDLPSQLSSPVAAPINGPVRQALLASSQAEPVLTANGHPVAYRYRSGAGQVLYLAFDPAIEPMAGWSGMKSLWQDLLGGILTVDLTNAPNTIGMTKFQNNPWAFTNALGNIPAMDLPSLRNMFILLIVYLLVAGLVNYLVLRKLDRREWTWFTVPGLALIFAGIIYVTSFGARPGEVVAHRIAMAEVLPGTGLAKVTQVSGLFAPARSNFTVRLPAGSLVSPLPSPDNPAMPVPVSQAGASTVKQVRRDPNVIIDQGMNQTTVQLQRMQAWAMRGFTVTEDVDLKGTISGEVSFQDNQWVATITNHTGIEFTEGLVVSVPNWFVKVGTLPPGGTVTARVDPDTSSALQAGPPFFYQIYNPQFNGRGPGQPPRVQPQDMLHEQILEGWFGNDARTGQGQILFLGWSSGSLGETALPTGGKTYYTSLVKVPLNVHFDPAGLEVPPGFINGTLVQAQNVDPGPPGTLVMRPGAEAVYQYILPAGQYQTMQVRFGQNFKDPNAGLTLSIYNWVKESWEPLQFQGANVDVPNRPEYVDRNRRVQLKLVNGPNFQQVYGLTVSLTSKGGGGQ